MTRTIKNIFMYGFLIIVSFFSVFPLYWMVSAATNKSVDVITGKIIPGTYLVENIKSLFAAQDVVSAFGNSVKYSLLLTFLSL